MEKYLYKIDLYKIDYSKGVELVILSSFTVNSFWIALSEFALKSKMMISNSNKINNRNLVTRTGYKKDDSSVVFMETETVDKSTGKSIYSIRIKTIRDRGVGIGFSTNTDSQYTSESYMSVLLSTATRLNELAKGHVEVGKVVACLASKSDKSPYGLRKAYLRKKKERVKL